MASMAVALVKGLDAKCIVVLDAYFAVGPVLLILKGLLDSNGKRLAHLITRAKKMLSAIKIHRPEPVNEERPESTVKN